MKKKKKDNLFDNIEFNNPYHLWGFIIVIAGITMGGALGGGIGAVAGLSIIKLDINSRKNSSHLKKIGLYSLISIGAIFAYLILSSILISFFS